MHYSQNRSKGLFCGLNLPDTLELISNCRTVCSMTTRASSKKSTRKTLGEKCPCFWLVECNHELTVYSTGYYYNTKLWHHLALPTHPSNENGSNDTSRLKCRAMNSYQRWHRLQTWLHLRFELIEIHRSQCIYQCISVSILDVYKMFIICTMYTVYMKITSIS